MAPIFDENEGLYYRVEVWDGDRVDLVLAKCARICIARAALDAAIAEYPGREVTLRQRTRVLDGTRFGRAAGPSLTRLPDIHVGPGLLMSSAMARCTLIQRVGLARSIAI